MIFIPIPLIRRKVIVRKLLRCGAVFPETAKTPDEAGIFKGIGLMFARLEARGILRSCGNDRYYIDTTKL